MHNTISGPIVYSLSRIVLCQKTRIVFRDCGRTPCSGASAANHDKNSLATLRSHAVRGRVGAPTLTRRVFEYCCRVRCEGALFQASSSDSCPEVCSAGTDGKCYVHASDSDSLTTFQSKRAAPVATAQVRAGWLFKVIRDYPDDSLNTLQRFHGDSLHKSRCFCDNLLDTFWCFRSRSPKGRSEHH